MFSSGECRFNGCVSWSTAVTSYFSRMRERNGPRYRTHARVEGEAKMTISARKTCQFLMVASFAVMQTWSLHAQTIEAPEVPEIWDKGYHVQGYVDGA